MMPARTTPPCLAHQRVARRGIPIPLEPLRARRRVDWEAILVLSGVAVMAVLVAWGIL